MKRANAYIITFFVLSMFSMLSFSMEESNCPQFTNVPPAKRFLTPVQTPDNFEGDDFTLEDLSKLQNANSNKEDTLSISRRTKSLIDQINDEWYERNKNRDSVPQQPARRISPSKKMQMLSQASPSPCQELCFAQTEERKSPNSSLNIADTDRETSSASPSPSPEVTIHQPSPLRFQPMPPLPTTFVPISALSSPRFNSHSSFLHHTQSSKNPGVLSGSLSAETQKSFSQLLTPKTLLVKSILLTNKQQQPNSVATENKQQKIAAAWPSAPQAPASISMEKAATNAAAYAAVDNQRASQTVCCKLLQCFTC